MLRKLVHYIVQYFLIYRTTKWWWAFHYSNIRLGPLLSQGSLNVTLIFKFWPSKARLVNQSQLLRQGLWLCTWLDTFHSYDFCLGLGGGIFVPDIGPFHLCKNIISNKSRGKSFKLYVLCQPILSCPCP